MRRYVVIDIVSEFEKLAEEWRADCESKNAISGYFIIPEMEHLAVCKLVALGNPAVPIIIEHYRKAEDGTLPWGIVLEKIIGISMYGNRSHKWSEIRNKWLEWYEKERKNCDKAFEKEDKGETDIADEFEKLAKEWSEHCDSPMVILSSNIRDKLDHSAYFRLIALGKPIIPFIVEKLRTENDGLAWGLILEKITGIRMFKDRRFYDPSELRKKWLKWWEDKEK